MELLLSADPKVLSILVSRIALQGSDPDLFFAARTRPCEGVLCRDQDLHGNKRYEQTRHHGGKHEYGHMHVFPESGNKGK